MDGRSRAVTVWNISQRYRLAVAGYPSPAAIELLRNLGLEAASVSLPKVFRITRACRQRPPYVPERLSGSGVSSVCPPTVVQSWYLPPSRGADRNDCAFISVVAFRMFPESSSASVDILVHVPRPMLGIHPVC